ncbi:bifunctional 5,10-methylenetetrahydrofolate dehydrogenase/5,10-methenyltetrahydrofolate cyclohydrolase [Bradyrhizobium sp. Ec3.3]|uniref:bifunctional 5,10-methylenetetrahydrofolate dehydrogenase/5,10-methenyltetrahydrofolate cyclohydrolase n=1 Tax=Bradyrhizobium sp. Ec3.3 TaxID=189753 RepID=UPI000A03DF6F|nr:tetrahydrofolate dehydrogenase/cyclohydrolase catalytic domain-containing protein [Bradyrhizobium sp. Ec3.3]
MNAILLDGRAIAETVRARVARDVAFLRAKCQVTPCLTVVLVGKEPASSVYVQSKTGQAQSVGLRSQQFVLPSNASEAELLGLIETLNADDSIDGILVQLPLHGHIDRWRVLEAVNPAKDVDGFHPYNVGRLAAGQPCLAPSPLGVVHLINTVVSDLSGLDVVVIGRSNIVGKPLAVLLGDAGCTVTSAQLQTQNLPDICRKSDIVVAAAGCAGLVRGDWLKLGERASFQFRFQQTHPGWQKQGAGRWHSHSKSTAGVWLELRGRWRRPNFQFCSCINPRTSST